MITLNADGWCTSKNIRQHPSQNYDQRPADIEVDLLVIHCIALPPKQYGGSFIDDFFTNCLDVNAHPFFATIANLKVSSHFVIDRHGTITQYVSTQHRAWHCGISSWQGRENCNDFSIGIELEGCAEECYTDQQYYYLQALTQGLMAQYPAITCERIVGHSDIAPQRKTDPGVHFDWARYKAVLTA